MLGWLKKILRRWLVDDTRPPAPYLDCRVAGSNGIKIVKVLVVGTVGVSLLGQRCDGEGELIISSFIVTDRQHFDRLWKHWMGNHQITWENGEPYNPMDKV